MNITGEIRIKDHITTNDMIGVIKTMVGVIIGKDENGIVKYTPYDREYGYKIGVAIYLLDGVEFDLENDKFYREINSSKEILNMIEVFQNNYTVQNEFINSNVDDIVEFKKQEYINKNDALTERLIKALDKEQVLNDLLLKIAENQNKVLTQQIKQNEYNDKVMELMTPEDTKAMNEKFLSGEFDINDLTEKLSEKVLKEFMNSDEYKDKYKKVIEDKNKQIVELKKYKQLHDARNVLADGK